MASPATEVTQVDGGCACPTRPGDLRGHRLVGGGDQARRGAGTTSRWPTASAGAPGAADRARALAQGCPRGMRLATGPQDRHGDAFYQKRVPKGAPEYVETGRRHLPVRPDRRRGVPDRDGGAGVGRADGHVDVPPVAVPARRRRPPRRAADRPRPAARHRLPRRGPGRLAPGRAGGAGLAGWPKTSGNRGVHIYVRIEPRWEFVDVRHAAIAFGRELERRPRE